MKELPSREHSFMVNVQGEETGQTWTGNITYRKPDIRAKSEISKLNARLNGDLKHLDEDMKFLHLVIATLTATLVDCPKWLRDANYGLDFDDINVLLDIYQKIKEFDQKYFEMVWGNQEAATIDSKDKESKDDSEQ